MSRQSPASGCVSQGKGTGRPGITHRRAVIVRRHTAISSRKEIGWMTCMYAMCKPIQGGVCAPLTTFCSTCQAAGCREACVSVCTAAELWASCSEYCMPLLRCLCCCAAIWNPDESIADHVVSLFGDLSKLKRGRLPHRAVGCYRLYSYDLIDNFFYQRREIISHSRFFRTLRELSQLAMQS